MESTSLHPKKWQDNTINMETLILSKVGDFSARIASFWDTESHTIKYQIVDTQKTFKTQKGAVCNAKKVLKKKREVYRKTHPKPEVEPVKRIRTKFAVKRNVWTQLLIYES